MADCDMASLAIIFSIVHVAYMRAVEYLARIGHIQAAQFERHGPFVRVVGEVPFATITVFVTQSNNCYYRNTRTRSPLTPAPAFPYTHPSLGLCPSGLILYCLALLL